jgi:hypothetical protein
MKKRKGILTLDMGIGLAALVLLTAYMVMKSEPLTSQVNEQLTLEDVLMIADGARSYKTAVNDGYTSVTMTFLSTDKYINSNFGDGSNMNPYGGNYTVGVGATQGDLQVTVSNIPAESCKRLQDKLAKYTVAVCASGVLTVDTI